MRRWGHARRGWVRGSALPARRHAPPPAADSCLHHASSHPQGHHADCQREGDEPAGHQVEHHLAVLGAGGALDQVCRRPAVEPAMRAAHSQPHWLLGALPHAAAASGAGRAGALLPLVRRQQQWPGARCRDRPAEHLRRADGAPAGALTRPQQRASPPCLPAPRHCRCWTACWPRRAGGAGGRR